MQFIISRASDEFRAVEMPNTGVQPHPRALWNKAAANWTINLASIESLVDLIGQDDILIVRKRNEGMASLLIDDINRR